MLLTIETNCQLNALAEDGISVTESSNIASDSHHHSGIPSPATLPFRSLERILPSASFRKNDGLGDAVPDPVELVVVVVLVPWLLDINLESRFDGFGWTDGETEDFGAVGRSFTYSRHANISGCREGKEHTKT